MPVSFSKQAVTVSVQMLLEILAFRPKSGRETLTHKGARTGMFAFRKHTARGHKLSKRVFEIGPSF